MKDLVQILVIGHKDITIGAEGLGFNYALVKLNTMSLPQKGTEFITWLNSTRKLNIQKKLLHYSPGSREGTSGLRVK